MAAGTYLLFTGLVLVLIFSMTSIGLIASVISRTRVQPLGIVVLVWAVGVFFVELVIIGMISSTSFGGGGLLLALRFNLVEIVRVLAIIQLEPDLKVLGPFGDYLLERAGTGGAPVILAAGLVAWITAPIALAAYIFESSHE